MNPGEYWFTRSMRVSPEPWFWGGVPDLDKMNTTRSETMTTADGPRLLSFFGSSVGAGRQPPRTPQPRPVAFPNPFTYRIGDARGDVVLNPANPYSFTYWYAFPAGLFFVPVNPTGVTDWITNRATLTSTSLYEFNKTGGYYVPDTAPPCGILVWVARNGAGTTPGTATPYALSIEVDGATVWTETVNPLTDVPQVWFIPFASPLDVAVRTCRATVAQDTSHPHICMVLGLRRFGTYHAGGDIPTGYTATKPGTIQAMIPSDQSAGPYCGKMGAMAYAHYRGGFSADTISALAGMDSVTGFYPLNRREFGGDVCDVACYDTYQDQYDGNAADVGPVYVDESGVLDFHVYSSTSPGSTASTFTVYRDSNWGRGGGTGATSLGSFTTPAGPGEHSTSLTLSTLPPKGGGTVTVSRSGGTWYGSRVSCRKTYAGPPPTPVVKVDAAGAETVLAGGLHVDQVVTLSPYVLRADGPAGGGEVQISLSGYPESSTPFTAHITWAGCDPGLYCVEYSFYSNGTGSWETWTPATKPCTGAALSALSDYAAYTHAGVRSVANRVQRSSHASYPSIRFRTVKTTASAVQTVTAGTTLLARPACPVSPSWLASYLSSLPHLFTFAAPADGRFLIRVIRKGSSDTNLPDIYSRSIVQRTVAADVDGYSHAAAASVVYPEAPELSTSISWLGPVRPTGIATSYPTSHPYAAEQFTSWIIAADTDWTGTPWEGHGGELAVGYVPRTTGSGAQAIPTNAGWQFFSIPEGTVYSNTDYSPSTKRLLIKDATEANGWRSLALADGIEIYAETLTMTATQVAQFRIAAIHNAYAGGMPQVSWSGSVAGGDRYYAEITAL